MRTAFSPALLTVALLGTALFAACAFHGPLEAPRSVVSHYPIENVDYYIISFDREGREVPTDQGEFLSNRVMAQLADEGSPVAVICIFSHGWQYDFRQARIGFREVLMQVVQMKADRAAMRQRQPAGSRTILIGLHWPSAGRTYLSFWYMRSRARLVGEVGGHDLLLKLQSAVRPGSDVRFHLIGHSLGGVVVAGMLMGPPGSASEVRPVDSLLLIQGAMSLWSFCSRIPEPPNPLPTVEPDVGPGYFFHLVRDGLVAGPIVVTYSEHDGVLRSGFRLANTRLGQPVRSRDEPPYGVGPNPTARYPLFGAIGSYGARGPLPRVIDMRMLPTGAPYGFARGVIYNIDSSEFIDGHHGYVNRETAHLIMQAQLAVDAQP